jgi:hypothetical protein
MLGFGLSFIKTPHARAKWFVNAKSQRGPNAQVAAHLDHDLRRIYASFIFQAMNALDFGFQSLAKRFEFRIPAGTFIETNPETGEQEEKPIWSEGGIEPIAWKPFVALRPEGVEPIWAKGTGEFDGINYAVVTEGGTPPPGSGAKAQRDENGEITSYDIDLYHALWFTNEKEQNFGSIFGYPRLGYALRYWWSYWLRWTIADRAFERKGDPSVIVRHPEGEFINEQTGERMDYGEYALLMGERMRSGGVIALPSEVWEDATGRGSTRQWDIEFTTEAVNFDPFDKSFDYLDVQKLRSLFIPEQAFLEGKGGTSSRNVAAELGESFVEQQAVLSAQIVEHINRFVIPQWIAVNYPEFMAENGVAEMVMQGFADEDVAFSNQVISLIGQQESGMREILKIVDLKRILQARGTPIADFSEQQRREQEIAAEVAAQQPPATAPIPGAQVGVVPTATGFSYIRPREVIELAESGTDFLASLPPSPHYEDRAIKGFARQLWNVYRDLYRDEYRSAIEAIDNFEASEDDVDAEDSVELAAEERFLRRAARMISGWAGSDRWPNVLERTLDIMERMARRAARIELKRVNLSTPADQSDLDDWLRDHIADFATKVAETTRTEVRDFVAARLADGITDREDIVRMAQEHFNEFPEWKADRLVRTEVRDVYNAATLLAARAAGIDRVQASDAQESSDTDTDCVERDGRIFTVDEAMREQEHPNGTLAWKLVPATNLSIERVEIGADDPIGRYDAETETIYLSAQATPEQERDYLKIIGDFLRS